LLGMDRERPKGNLDLGRRPWNRRRQIASSG
jgi:hypothetical protein